VFFRLNLLVGRNSAAQQNGADGIGGGGREIGFAQAIGTE
jgi:hypothetical protein